MAEPIQSEELGLQVEEKVTQLQGAEVGMKVDPRNASTPSIGYP